MLCNSTIIKLIEIYRDNTKVIKSIVRCIMSFEEYHSSIYKMETWMKIYGNNSSKEEHKDTIANLDKSRTLQHNALLGNVNLLNRLAEKINYRQCMMELYLTKDHTVVKLQIQFWNILISQLIIADRDRRKVCVKVNNKLPFKQ